MKSFAVTLSGLLPRTTTLTVSGTVSRTSFVIQELKIAVVPTPNATHPTAPACGVWESEPMITIPGSAWPSRDRKSTRLNSSHLVISYAVFCLKKKKKTQTHDHFAHTRADAV